jgi:mono/diheme cytochrome c family protein
MLKKCQTWALLAAAGACFATGAQGADVTPRADGAARFRKHIEPILSAHCFGCHGGGQAKGGVTFDQFPSDAALLDNHDLWWKALKMLRAGLMPPPQKKRRPTAAQVEQVADWIKRDAFRIDPHHPDPGRVTVRRLNRAEYRNTVRDLLGVNYDTDAEFPPDDTGHGIDNIGDVLSLSPLLLEKYLTAARAVVAQAVPQGSASVAERRLAGGRFRGKGAAAGRDGSLSLSYYQPATASTAFRAEHTGCYQLLLDLAAQERFVDGMFDYNKCRLLLKVDDKVVFEHTYGRQGGKSFHYEIDQTWKAGAHTLTFELQPLTKEKQVRSLALRVVGVTVRGPLEKEHWVRPPNYARFFPRAVPETAAQRRQYARELLRDFASRAFRRPVDEPTVERLAALAEGVYGKGRPFEVGVAQAMTVVLASPRFLFREEGVEPAPTGTHPLLDEYALAARLSYFLWSSMPDAELFRLAGEHRLRKELHAQVARMLADPRSAELVRHFVGQWLQARDIETVEVSARAVISRDEPPDPQRRQRFFRFRQLARKPQADLTDAEKKELAEMRKNFVRGFRRFAQFELNRELRRTMRRETEMLFEHILRNDRNLLELLDSDYTFLNERLAKQYGIDGVKGDEMRLVKLPPDSPRGGVLTQATVLVTTSNPDRTSPVKRGLFILDNVLGVPPAPPPPDIPALEEATDAAGGQPPTLREALAIHRGKPLCSSCHNRMDPLGLAFEHFNALGRWRDKERQQPIDAAGQLITGESFRTVRELKRILVTNHRRDFYRCLTEKLLTYALGRGLEYYDVEVVDEIVSRLEKADGRPSALLAGVIEAAPFQRRRAAKPAAAAAAD